MNALYQNIKSSAKKGEKLLAVLIDPDKMKLESVKGFIAQMNGSVVTHIFVGGSTVKEHFTSNLVKEIKKYSKLPIILFPGDTHQISVEADGILFLSLISGRNPDYLIGKHVDAVPRLLQSDLEVLSTGYLLIENGKETAVERVTKTKPLKRSNIQAILDTAKAGEFLGMKLIYLEAGSGAHEPVSPEIIRGVKNILNVPLIVGGGIRTKQQLEQAYKSGADIIVIGTALEEDEFFLEKCKVLE